MQNKVCFSLTRKFRSIFIRSICLTRPSYETHYEVLKLSRNCSSKDIRNSFIKLSKEYHPDKNSNDPDRHNKFVKLNEAYSVLSRPESRREYDLGLIPGRRNVSYAASETYYQQETRTMYQDLYENRDKSKDEENMNKPYYGIKGIKKVSNMWILGMLMVFASTIVGLQFVLIYKSFTFSRKVLDERSAENYRIYAEVRREASKEGGDEAVVARLWRSHDKYTTAHNEDAKKD